MLLQMFWICLLLTINRLSGEHCFYISNHHCLFDYRMQIYNNGLIDWIDLISLLFLFYIFALLIDNWLKVKTCFRSFFSRFVFVVFQSNFLWSFGFNISVKDCLPVFLCWLYQNSLIPIIVLRCDWKLSLGHIYFSFNPVTVTR